MYLFTFLPAEILFPPRIILSFPQFTLISSVFPCVISLYLYSVTYFDLMLVSSIHFIQLYLLQGHDDLILFLASCRPSLLLLVLFFMNIFMVMTTSED